ncbi:hypothetical protein WICPIJ_004585 [Wickerhamomyces pijperi]|uniref:Uncharacterized protein n=1 Tax=Wickerhamomyces pijperi TaxID=599730 RepID=A0A9P8Q7U3_WICPI|nr:hypothetical protein WICPIJ_004585 [Wickerhamomyces pijperi]
MTDKENHNKFFCNPAVAALNFKMINPALKKLEIKYNKAPALIQRDGGDQQVQVNCASAIVMVLVDLFNVAHQQSTTDQLTEGYKEETGIEELEFGYWRLSGLDERIG